MAGVVEKRRSQLRKDLLDAALVRIEQDGLKALRARDLATDVGCSLGAIYNVFQDMDDLGFYANGETLRALGAALSKASTSLPDRNPTDQLIALADAYLEFCQSMPKRWTALFTQRVPPGKDLPDWYRQALDDLIGRIAAPVAALRPDLPAREVRNRALGLFSAAHGVIYLGLQSSFFTTTPDQIRITNATMIRAFALSGAEAESA